MDWHVPYDRTPVPRATTEQQVAEDIIQGRMREKKTVPEVAEQLSPLDVGADQMRGHSNHPKPARRGGSTTV